MDCVAHSDVEPGVSYLFDRKTKKLTKQFRLWEKLPREALAEKKPVTYKSSDGLEIPAYLTLPKGVPAKNLPLIMLPHGGPWARDNGAMIRSRSSWPTAATLCFNPISADPPAMARSS